MRIWIDLATGPQVLFMRPIIRELQKRGNSVLITTREFTETVSLADRFQLDQIVVGAHGGSTMLGKGWAVFRRAIRLVNIVRQYRATLALGSSHTQALVAPLLRIPFIVCVDYEGNPANHITCHVARKILVPNVFHKPNMQKFGASPDTIISYGGIKENVYLSDFLPDPAFRESIGIPSNKIVVTMRPPSEVSAYHRFKNPLFDELLLWVSNHENTVIVLLPRGQEQRLKFDGMRLQNVLIPQEVLDGPNLIYSSDLVVGAGGTMNREATVLGTPVYTVFKGELGSVDRYLIETGKMVRIETIDDIAKINIKKKTQTIPEWQAKGNGLVNEVVDKILEV